MDLKFNYFFSGSSLGSSSGEYAGLAGEYAGLDGLKWELNFDQLIIRYYLYAGDVGL